MIENNWNTGNSIQNHTTNYYEITTGISMIDGSLLFRPLGKKAYFINRIVMY